MSVHQAYLRNSLGNFRQCQKLCFVSLIFLVLLLVSSGCTGVPENTVKTTVVDVPPDMRSASLEFSMDFRSIGTSIVSDAYGLAEKFGAAASNEEMQTIARDYYADNMWAEKILYYDAVKGDFIELPYSGNKQILDYVPLVREKDLDGSDGTLHLDCIYVPESGYLDLIYVSVYDNAGTYKGHLVIAYDVGVVLKEHPVAAKTAHSYDNLICYVLNKDGRVIYSSKPEYIGTIIPMNSPYVAAQCVISPQTGSTGAYTYTSREFYYYDKSTYTEKITSWQTFTSFKTPYTLYLTKELNSPELNYGNILTPGVEAMETDIRDLYLHAVNHGKEAAENRVNHDYYSTQMYVVDMNGTILASPSNEDGRRVGMNFMNFRDTYGVSFMEQMIFTAQQGNGYVYFDYPVDGTISPRAAIPYVGHVLLVDDDWFIIGMTHADTKISSINYQLRDDVTLVSRTAVKMAYEYGVDTLISHIRSNVGKDGTIFVPEITTSVPDVGVFNYEGYLYASLAHDELTNSCQTGYTDIYGGSTVRRGIMVAKSGGGAMTNLVARPDSEGILEWWVYIVEPIDNNYYVYAGTCIGECTDYLTPYLSK